MHTNNFVRFLINNVSCRQTFYQNAFIMFSQKKAIPKISECVLRLIFYFYLISFGADTLSLRFQYFGLDFSNSTNLSQYNFLNPAAGYYNFFSSIDSIEVNTFHSLVIFFFFVQFQFTDLGMLFFLLLFRIRALNLVR